MATGVHILASDASGLSTLMDYLNDFADGRNDVVLVGEGAGSKSKILFVVIEFDTTPDDKFLVWLDADEAVLEFFPYTILQENAA